jgi:L-lysine 6-transaminase
MRYQINFRPSDVYGILQRRILRDGLDLVMDLEKSHGVWVYDKLHNRELLDFFGCYATIPLGYNHPKMTEDENFLKHLLRAAIINPTNADIYTEEYAHFMQVFERVAIPSYLKYAFFIAGGALAVENALKVAMDWKVQKNFQKGYRREVGTKVIHFEEAFHGRSGYTMSLTNTDPAKSSVLCEVCLASDCES